MTARVIAANIGAGSLHSRTRLRNGTVCINTTKGLSGSTDAPKARILGHDLVKGETRDCNEMLAQIRRLS